MTADDYKATSRDLDILSYELTSTCSAKVTPYDVDEISCEAGLYHVNDVWIIIIRDDIILDGWAGEPVYCYSRLPDHFPDISNKEFCDILNRTVPPVLNHGNRAVKESETLQLLLSAQRNRQALYTLSETGVLEETTERIIAKGNVTPIQNHHSWDCILTLKQLYQGTRPIGSVVAIVKDCYAIGKNSDDYYHSSVILPETFPNISPIQFCNILNAIPLPPRVYDGYRKISKEEVIPVLENAKAYTVDLAEDEKQHGQGFKDLLKRYFK